MLAIPISSLDSSFGVLIVDRSEENREVLRTVLQSHGVHTLVAAKDIDGLCLAKQFHPKVYVLDLDTIDPTNATVCADYDSHTREENASVVLLGHVPSGRSRLPASEVVAKPYHYAPLIRKIEGLLQEAERRS